MIAPPVVVFRSTPDVIPEIANVVEVAFVLDAFVNIAVEALEAPIGVELMVALDIEDENVPLVIVPTVARLARVVMLGRDVVAESRLSKRVFVQNRLDVPSER